MYGVTPGGTLGVAVLDQPIEEEDDEAVGAGGPVPTAVVEVPTRPLLESTRYCASTAV